MNMISRLAPESVKTRAKMFRVAHKIIADNINRDGGRKIAIKRDSKFLRKDLNIRVMSFYFLESGGGYIILNINQVNQHAEIYCRLHNGQVLYTNIKKFREEQMEIAESFLSSPNADYKIVYKFARVRPLDNLEEILINLDDAMISGKNKPLYYLCPNFDKEFFDPSLLFKNAGINFKIVDLEFVNNNKNHVICVPKKFPGWKKFIKLIYNTYQGDSKTSKDISKIFITLEVEKRIWAEQVEGIGKFLVRARQQLGRPLTIYINGMTSTVSGKYIAGFENIQRKETEFVNKISQIAPKDTIILRGFGKTISEKIHDCKEFGFYVGPLGTSSVIPIIFSIPGITYHNEYFINYKMKKLNIPYLIRISPEHIKNLDNHVGFAPYKEKRTEIQWTGYSINAEIFVKSAFEHFCVVQKKYKADNEKW